MERARHPNTSSEDLLNPSLGRERTAEGFLRRISPGYRIQRLTCPVFPGPGPKYGFSVVPAGWPSPWIYERTEMTRCTLSIPRHGCIATGSAQGTEYYISGTTEAGPRIARPAEVGYYRNKRPIGNLVTFNSFPGPNCPSARRNLGGWKGCRAPRLPRGVVTFYWGHKPRGFAQGSKPGIPLSSIGPRAFLFGPLEPGGPPPFGGKIPIPLWRDSSNSLVPP